MDKPTTGQESNTSISIVEDAAVQVQASQAKVRAIDSHHFVYKLSNYTVYTEAAAYLLVL